MGVAKAQETTFSDPFPSNQSELHLFTRFETNTTLHEFNDPEKVSNLEIWLNPSFNWKRKFDLSALFVVNKELSGDRKSQLNSTSATVRHARLPLTELLSLSPAVTLPLGLGKKKRKEESLYLGVQLRPRFYLDLEGLGAKGFNAFYELSYSRYFHEYETTFEGSGNVEQSLSNWLNLGYQIFSEWSLTAGGILTNGATYQKVTKSSFQFYQEVGFDLNKKVNLTLGHTNSGNTLAMDGQSSNVSFFDAQDSTVYFQFNFLI